ncbi:membrane protein insertion efficiency factor YidD [Caldimonas brevitalea]|uniref:membrane protein insertion efficiency factor YidD n=1 Tax=Caldimonas brevitalea TaxID=413882 RepID=UPI0009FA0505
MISLSRSTALDAIADSAIGLYQRYVSPYKGFRCAHRVHSGGASCSQYARKIVRRLGLTALFAAMPRQFERCRRACHLIRAAAANASAFRRPTKAKGERTQRSQQRQHARQRDSRDCGDCGSCDLPDPSGACDAASSCADVGACDCSL